MDFCDFGLLRRALGKRHTRILKGLLKTVLEEWGRTYISVLGKSLLSKIIRARVSVKLYDFQIEANRRKKGILFIKVNYQNRFYKVCPTFFKNIIASVKYILFLIRKRLYSHSVRFASKIFYLILCLSYTGECNKMSVFRVLCH